MTRLWRIVPFLGIFLLAAGNASASGRLPVVGPTDYWFTFDEPTVLEVRAYAIEYGIDSMLWLYDEAGNVVAQNDDWFFLDSWLSVPVQAGSYRLRAGVCCGNPDAWYGVSYEVEVNGTPVETTTTTSTTTTSSTTTTEPETTTTSEAPVTDPPATDPPTTEPETTTTQPEETWPPTTIPSPPDTTPKTTSSSSSTTSTTSSTTSTTLPPTTTVPPTTTLLATTLPATTSPVTAVAPTTNAPTETAVATTARGTVTPTVTNAPTTTTSPTPSDTPIAPPNNATDEQKQQFESQVNVFAGGYDNYVPAGSTITVAQRRTMVAATVAVSTALPGPIPRKKRK